jgi:hypothetical protein
MRGIFILLFFFVLGQSFGQSPDTIKPVITARGDVAISMCQWYPYTDAGYDVSDNKDPKSDITIEVLGTFQNTNAPGLFTLKYKATDKAGNFSFSETRYIQVISECDPRCEGCMTDTPQASGINNSSAKLNIHIYPTISSRIFYISSQRPRIITGLGVYNITGKLVKSCQGNELISNQYGIDLSEMINGIYFIRIGTGTSEVVQKVVIQK